MSQIRRHQSSQSSSRNVWRLGGRTSTGIEAAKNIPRHCFLSIWDVKRRRSRRGVLIKPSWVASLNTVVRSGERRTLLSWNKKFLIKKKSQFEASMCVYVSVMLIERKASAAVKSSLSAMPPLWLVPSLKCHPGLRLHADISMSSSPSDTVTPQKLGFLIYSNLTVTQWFLTCGTELQSEESSAWMF